MRNESISNIFLSDNNNEIVEKECIKSQNSENEQCDEAKMAELEGSEYYLICYLCLSFFVFKYILQ